MPVVYRLRGAAVGDSERSMAMVGELLRRRDLPPRERKRLEMVKAAGLGHDSATIARWTGRSTRTVRHWLGRFAAGGVGALRVAPRAGRPPKADATYRASLAAAVTTSPRALGLAFDVWTSARLGAYLAEATGVRVAPGWVRALLTRDDFVCGRPKHTLRHLRDPDELAACEAELAAVGKKVRAAPRRYELHYEDETHLETNPHLTRVWHRRGVQPTVPAAGANRRLTAFGSVEALGRGRVEVLGAGQDSGGFARYLAALEARHADTGRQVYLVLDNGPCHTSKASRAALAGRADWLRVVWLSRYSPQLNPKEREWHVLKRDVRSHLAGSLRAFADEILAGLRRLGGDRLDIVDAVPDWFLDGHRRPPTGRPPGRPAGSKDSYQRVVRRRNLPAPT